MSYESVARSSALARGPSACSLARKPSYASRNRPAWYSAPGPPCSPGSPCAPIAANSPAVRRTITPARAPARAPTPPASRHRRARLRLRRARGQLRNARHDRHDAGVARPVRVHTARLARDVAQILLFEMRHHFIPQPVAMVSHDARGIHVGNPGSGGRADSHRVAVDAIVLERADGAFELARHVLAISEEHGHARALSAGPHQR